MPDPNRIAVMEATRAHFVERFAAEPRSLAIAPARVNLIGEHTDYSDGFVLPAALPLYTCVAVAPAAGPETVLVSTRFGEQRLAAAALHSASGFGRYLAGAIGESSREDTALSILVHGDMPVEAGLSSSASLLVAALAALRRMTTETTLLEQPGHALRLELALAARRVENDHIGVPCGFMDQFAVACAVEGQAMLLDCLDNQHTAVPTALPGHSWVVIYSGIRRELAASDYGARVEAVKTALARMAAADLDGPHILRTHNPAQVELLARSAGVASSHLPLLNHVAADNARVHLMRYALERGAAPMAATILRLGHNSLSRQFGVSLPVIDEFFEAGYKLDGVRGLRLTGAGMGGSLVALVANDNLDELMGRLETVARRIMSPDAAVFGVAGFVAGVSWR